MLCIIIMANWIGICFCWDKENVMLVLGASYRGINPIESQYFPILLCCFSILPYLLIREVIYLSLSVLDFIQVIDRVVCCHLTFIKYIIVFTSTPYDSSYWKQWCGC